MNSKYEGMYRSKQKKNKEDSNAKTKHSKNTCYVESSFDGRAKKLRCSSPAFLIFSVITLFIDGLLIAVGRYSIQRTTSSVKHVQQHIPSYLSASMVSSTFSSSFGLTMFRCDLQHALQLIISVHLPLLLFNP